MKKRRTGEFFIAHLCMIAIMFGGHPLAALGTSVPSTVPTQSSTTTTTPSSTQAQQSQAHAQHSKNLGKNKLAQLAAWVSLIGTASFTIFFSYKTFEELFDQIMLQLPVLKIHHGGAAQIVSTLLVAPASIYSLLRVGPLGWYFYYMLYAGERLSPLLAQKALHDLSVYVNHLQTVKTVQAELLAVIDLINQELDAKKQPVLQEIDMVALEALGAALEQNDVYIQQVIAQLHVFLSDDEIAAVLQAMQPSKDIPDFSITTNLQDQAHTIAQNLQASDVDLGYDVVVLNQLIRDLIGYWQQYTVSLAEGIDNSLQFCTNVYAVEQVIINWFDRSLFSA